MLKTNLRDTPTDYGIPNIMCAPVLLDKTVTSSKNRCDEGKVSGPIHTLFSRSTHCRSHLLPAENQSRLEEGDPGSEIVKFKGNQ